MSGKYYTFVIVDDFSRYTWVLFLANKDDALDAFKVFCKKFKMKKGMVLHALEVIMEESLKTMHLKPFAII